MTDSNWQEEITPVLRQCQIIVGSLIAGSVVFLVIVLFRGQPQAANAGPPVMTYVALVFMAVILVARAIVPVVVARLARRRIVRGETPFLPTTGGAPIKGMIENIGDAGRLALVFQTKTIIAGALLEGCAFFLLVVHMIEGSPISLGAALALILALAMLMPTRGRIVRWIENQLELLEQERQLQDAEP